MDEWVYPVGLLVIFLLGFVVSWLEEKYEEKTISQQGMAPTATEQGEDRN